MTGKSGTALERHRLLYKNINLANWCHILKYLTGICMTEVSAKNTQVFPWYTYVRVSSVSFCSTKEMPLTKTQLERLPCTCFLENEEETFVAGALLAHTIKTHWWLALLAGLILRERGRVGTVLTYFIENPPDRGWQRSEGLLLLHSFLSLDILVSVFDT